MKLHPDEMWLLYNCDIESHKKTRAHAYSITDNVNEIPLQHCNLSRWRWAEILNMLGMHPKEIFDKSLPEYKEKLAGHDFDENDWLEILRQNPCMIKAPIAIMNGKAVLCTTPKDVYKLEEG